MAGIHVYIWKDGEIVLDYSLLSDDDLESAARYLGWEFARVEREQANRVPIHERVAAANRLHGVWSHMTDKNLVS